MSAWKQGIKEAFKEVYEERAKKAELDWLNDYENNDKWDKAVKTREKANSYN